MVLNSKTLVVVIGCLSVPFCDCVDCSCSLNGDFLICERCLPKVLPTGVRKVKVTNNLMSIANETFSHYSWQFVTSLDITEREDITFSFSQMVFVNLKELVRLGMHIQTPLISIQQFGNGTLHGLSKLERLDLSYSTRFSFPLLFRLLLNENNFKALKMLVLNNFGSMSEPLLRLDFNNTFFSILAWREISVLTAKQNEIKTLYLNPLHKICLSLKNLSVSFSHINDIHMIRNRAACRSLENLDFSGLKLPIPFLPFGTLNLTGYEPVINVVYYISKVKALFLDTVFSEKFLTKNRLVIIFDENIELNIERISLRKNNFRFLNVECHTFVLKQLKSLDISINELQYISPKFFGNMTGLKSVSVANNNLYRMPSYFNDDFKRLFLYLKKLERVNLDDNGLEEIPKDIFAKNPQIKIMKLSKNKLSDFFLNGNFYLSYIDLSKIIYRH